MESTASEPESLYLAPSARSRIRQDTREDPMG